MISEAAIIARFERLDGGVLHRWIALGWLKPQREETGYVFDETDVARTHLLCDLRFEMGIGDEELGVVLSLVDQLHNTRGMLRALATAIGEQPEELREAIMVRTRVLLTPSSKGSRL
jgi:chaperone modulatory protein CbpM